MRLPNRRSVRAFLFPMAVAAAFAALPGARLGAEDLQVRAAAATRQLSRIVLKGDHPVAAGREYRPFFGHAGLDFDGTGDGASVYSPVSGTVIANTGDCGKIAIYDGRNTIILAHLGSRTRVGRDEEERILAGDYVGLSSGAADEAGCAAREDRLHLEIRVGLNASLADPGKDNRSTTIDPLSYAFVTAPEQASEITPQQRQALDLQEAERLRLLQNHPGLRFRSTAVQATACGNGDFESGIDATQWAGGNGMVDNAGDPNFLNFTGGLFPGPLDSPSSHQTWVAAGTDAVVGISQVAPGGSTHSARIGNMVNGCGSELLSKTFVVTPADSVINFWYAVVFEDPMHSFAQQPSFWVRVLDSTGAVIPGAANLGNNSDKLVAQTGNPFFVNKPSTSILYRDWSCAQIDLSSQVGKTVTVQFVTEDCALCGHYGYAYIDDVCGSCAGDPSGNITFNQDESSNCGSGMICFDYTLPSAGNTVGTVTIGLDFLENGIVVRSLDSPTLEGGSRYCFHLDPTSQPGSPDGFDFVATGRFTIDNNALAPKTVGSAPDGVRPGPNNDYKIACGWGCCTGPNLIQNGGFESGYVGFSSSFLSTPNPPNTVLPGEYGVLEQTRAAFIASTWNVQDHSTCSAAGNFLVANGSTGLSGSRKVWGETVGVTPGKEYRFCANLRNMPQCAFDVKPKVELRFSSPADTTQPSVISANPADACNWVLESRSIQVPAGVTSLTSEIWLDETGKGDGNDLALDDISLQEIAPADAGYVLLNIATSKLTASSYNVTATPVGGQPFSYFWDVCEVNASDDCIASTQVTNPLQWQVPGPNDFKGYVGTNVLVTASPVPGVFETGKRYRIRYGVFDQCVAWTEKRWYFGFSLSAKQVVVKGSMAELLSALD
ncbi:MAG: hypothetical protein ABUT39_29225 [Acidobacteriota bacterium]